LARAPDVVDPLVVTQPIHMELVRMPAWEFVMGSDPVKQKSAEPNEKPEHRVSLPGYYIGKYEVTNAQYRAFVKATGHAVPAHWVQGTIPVGEEQHPVVYVSWYDAQAFADWVRGESGRAFRLPTEAEWEKACRTAQGSLYPWGDSLPDSATANFGGRQHPRNSGHGRQCGGVDEQLAQALPIPGDGWPRE
jgi:serine/threonine-protein kinase